MQAGPLLRTLVSSSSLETSVRTALICGSVYQTLCRQRVWKSRLGM